MKRTNIEVTTSLALLYLFQATNGICKIISRDKVLEYDTTINEILSESKNSDNYRYYIDNEPIYFYSQDEIGNEYLVLKSNMDIKTIQTNIGLGTLPLEFLVASQNSRALDIIGIELEKGQFIKKEPTSLEHKKDSPKSKKL